MEPRLASPQSEWLTAREAAPYLKVAHRTILEWAKTGRIPAHRLSGTLRITWRLRATELPWPAPGLLVKAGFRGFKGPFEPPISVERYGS
jgi:excisionase family DNA binding protein